MVRVVTLVAIVGAILGGTAGAQGTDRLGTDLVARGRYVVETIGACGNCHTPKGPTGDLPGRHLAGGAVFDEPPFRAVAPNITPDPETGIGRWTDAQIALAIREGRRPDGSIIGPPMPIELYRGLSDRDLAAIVAYLRTVPPVSNPLPRSEYRIPLPPSYGPPVTVVADPPDEAPSPADATSPAPWAIARNATPPWWRAGRATGPGPARAASPSTAPGAPPSRGTSRRTARRASAPGRTRSSSAPSRRAFRPMADGSSRPWASDTTPA